MDRKRVDGGIGGVQKARALEVYFLPMSSWEAATHFQSRLIYEMGEPPRRRGSLVLCEHLPIATIGRQGSRGQLRTDMDDELPVRYVGRGGGVWLQTPGQLAAYAVLPFDPPHHGVDWLRRGLSETLLGVLADFQILGRWNEHQSSADGILVEDRQIAAVGASVRQGVTCFGSVLNVCLPPGREELYQVDPKSEGRRETCMLRERLLPVRPGAVRESFARRFAESFGYDTYYVCHPPAVVDWKKPANVAVR